MTLPLVVLWPKTSTSPLPRPAHSCPFLGRQVNIDHVTKDITVRNLGEPSRSSFDLAQKRVHALMEKDCLPRFLRSACYQELVL